MRAIWIPKHGTPDVLEVRTTPDPEPRAGEVRIRVHASGLNFAEVMARQGLYPDAPKTPCVVGYEVAGIVDAVGPGADGALVGRRVCAMIRFGGHADVVCLPAVQVFPIPEAMSFEEAAALPVNYVTAYHMLFRTFRIRSGDTVLVHMAAGGVGTAALQLCRTVPGVRTIGTASAGKHDYVRSHGCDHAIDYRSTDYAKAVMEITDGKGVDLVLDALGGPDWQKSYDLLRAGGLHIAFGWANMNAGDRRNPLRILGQLFHIPRFTPLRLMDQNRGVAGVNMGHMWHETERIAEQANALLALYREGRIKPHVDRVFRFEEAAEAHRYLEHGKNVGKVVLVP